MSDDKFDAIVVGAGVAGSVAALVMARAGLDVLVIERGDSAGCKNMTGGRLYAHTRSVTIHLIMAMRFYLRFHLAEKNIQEKNICLASFGE